MSYKDDDPIAQDYLRRFREAWSHLGPDLRDRLRAGADVLSIEDVDRLAAAPHSFVTLTYWVEGPGSIREAWNVHPAFAEWATQDASPEGEL